MSEYTDCTLCVYDDKDIRETPCINCTHAHVDGCYPDLFKAKDNVNHPAHYETGKYECIEVMEEVFGTDALQNFCLCNAFKYVYRCNRKNGLEDINKAIWYLNKYKELVEK